MAAASLSHTCRAGAQRQERLLGGVAGTDPVVTGNLVVVGREVAVVDRGVPRCGPSVPRHFGGTPVVEGADHDFVGAVVMTDPHALAQ